MDFLETIHYFDFNIGLQLLYYIYSSFSYSGNKSWGGGDIANDCSLTRNKTAVQALKISSFDQQMMMH